MEKMEQQVDVVATITLSLDASIGTEDIDTTIRDRLTSAFAGVMPESIPDDVGGQQCPVNFVFWEEREIYDSDSDEETTKSYFIRFAGLPFPVYTFSRACPSRSIPWQIPKLGRLKLP